VYQLTNKRQNRRPIVASIDDRQFVLAEIILKDRSKITFE